MGDQREGQDQMHELLRRHPAMRELHQLINELSLVSHVGAKSFDCGLPPDSGEDIGGRRPSGGIDFHDDRETDYHQKSADYFERRCDRCTTIPQVERLRDEAKEALEAWKRTPLRPGDLPVWGTPECRDFIVNNPRGYSQRKLADSWGVSHVAIGKIQRKYRSRQAAA